MSRHAEPLDAYDADDRVGRLHDRMLADALADITGLAKSWPAPDGLPYDITIGTGTLRRIVIG